MQGEEVRASAPFRRYLLLILLVACVLRCWRLNASSYWLDEILQVYFVQGTWKFFWTTLRLDAVHPPLDYLVTRLVNFSHPADWVRKLPAILWGTVTIGALAALLRRRIGEEAALAGALLLALAPFHVRYSQELRPYSLGLCLLSLSLLLLDRYLDWPTWPRLLAFYLCSLATAYTLYLAAVVLPLAAAALLVEDALSNDSGRRTAARRFLVWSPVFLLASLAPYLPWIPVVMEAAHRAPPAASPPMNLARFGQLLAFFSFASEEGQPLRPAGLAYILLAATGVVLACRRKSARFLVFWLLIGCASTETLEQLHPHFYTTRHFLTAGLALPILAALPLALLFAQMKTRAIATFALTIVGVLDLGALRNYYRDGRPDWRTIGSYLSARPRTERIFAENQYTALCVAYYTAGPEYLYRQGRLLPDVASLDGEAIRVARSWTPGTTAWLVLGGSPQHEQLRAWSSSFPTLPFPRAQGASLRRLDPELLQKMTASVPRPPKS